MLLARILKFPVVKLSGVLVPGVIVAFPLIIAVGKGSTVIVHVALSLGHCGLVTV